MAQKRVGADEAATLAQRKDEDWEAAARSPVALIAAALKQNNLDFSEGLDAFDQVRPLASRCTPPLAVTTLF